MGCRPLKFWGWVGLECAHVEVRSKPTYPGGGAALVA